MADQRTGSRVTSRRGGRRARSAALALCAVVGAAGVAYGGAPTDGIDRLEFMIGEWDQHGTMSPETFGDSGGEYSGPCSCRWGPFRAWVECDFESPRLAGLGEYAVHVIIRPDPQSGGYRSFVINNHGDSTYTGRWTDASTLVFTAERGESVQRVRYRPLDDGRVEFYVDQSSDGGSSWTAHTDAHWYRVAVEAADR